MKLDLHVHIRRQHRIEDLKRAVKARGIVGQEVESKRGHILAIGIEEKIPDHLEPEETVRLIHAQRGIAIWAHPYLGWNSILPHGRDRYLPFDAIEYFNHRCGPLLWPNFLAKLGVRHHPLPKVSNTDSKDLVTIGRCYNEVPVAKLVDGERYTPHRYGELVPEILHCIRKGKIRRHEEWEMMSRHWLISNFSRLYWPSRRSTCVHCGDKITVKLIRRTYTCLICGQRETRHVCCARGHFVCRGCRTGKALETSEINV